MFVEEIRRAIETAPRGMLAELSSAVWKGHAAGSLSDDDAQAMAELIAARKVTAPPKRVTGIIGHIVRLGSRPRSHESLARRRRWVAAGRLPPTLAGQFTQGEQAALAVIAIEIEQRGVCNLEVGIIAARAGVCRSTAKNATRAAANAGLIHVRLWKIGPRHNAPNTITITSREWKHWLRLRGRRAPDRPHVPAPRVYRPRIDGQIRDRNQHRYTNKGITAVDPPTESSVEAALSHMRDVMAARTGRKPA